MAFVQSPHHSRCTCFRYISGKSFSTTKVSLDFATRVGWLHYDLKERNCGYVAGEYDSQLPAPFSCFVAVGDCRIRTTVEITDSLALFESSAPFDEVEWHIHIGDEDFKALERCGWDKQICYMDMMSQEGLPSRPPDCSLGCISFIDALSTGHADCMRYWHRMSITSLAGNTSEGDDEPLRLSMQQPHPSCWQAAQSPCAEALMYVHDVLGFPWDADACAAAALAGSVDCLGYAHCSACPWDASVCSMAAAAGSLACLVYAHEHGCKWDWNTCAMAALYGHLDCLVYARAHGCEWDERTCSWAASSGNLEILTYAVDNGCRWDACTCSGAAFAGSMECLVYARELGCPWDADTCRNAAMGKRLQCLQYAHERGCCWNEDTLYAAAEVGDLDCLMYAHKHGCPYVDASAVQFREHGLTCAAVQKEMSLPCLKYVRESMNCSWDACGTEWKMAFREGRCDVLEYIHLHGGSWCKEEELLEMEDELDAGEYVHDDYVDGKARCLLYMHCCGGCKLPDLRGTVVGERVLALMQERRAAVLMSFWAAGRARAGSRTANAAHAAMEMVPTDLIKQIICAAKLLIAD
ncbi:hypothetical protein COCOBI_14-4170 [Coccomyxa sp. Obi]|nr:hypothetical protein COCOBI_14-4170 [Coccomyxa sp. Obi]